MLNNDSRVYLLWQTLANVADVSQLWEISLTALACHFHFLNDAFKMYNEFRENVMEMFRGVK